MNEKEIRFIDLFGGVGGFSLGLESCNPKRHLSDFAVRGSEKVQEQPKYACVWYNDFDKYAVQTYNSRFGTSYKPTDITKVRSEDIPEHELLCGGFPCQSFSIAGKRGGFEDTRGTMFFEIARILRDKRPKMLLLENVKGLLSHDSGRTFATILNTLSELGYVGQYEVLNSKNFGVPQNRERVFIFGFRGERCPKVFPLGESGRVNDEEVSYAIDANYWKGTRDIRRRQRTMIMAWSKSHRTGNTEADRRRYNYGCVEERVKFGEFNTISTGKGGGNQSTMNFVKNEQRIRRLTPTECERLQGFPDNWTAGASDTQRYKMMGNAVTVNVIQAIGERIIHSLNSQPYEAKGQGAGKEWMEQLVTYTQQNTCLRTM